MTCPSGYTANPGQVVVLNVDNGTNNLPAPCSPSCSGYTVTVSWEVPVLVQMWQDVTTELEITSYENLEDVYINGEQATGIQNAHILKNYDGAISISISHYESFSNPLLGAYIAWHGTSCTDVDGNPPPATPTPSPPSTTPPGGNPPSSGGSSTPPPNPNDPGDSFSSGGSGGSNPPPPPDFDDDQAPPSPPPGTMNYVPTGGCTLCSFCPSLCVPNYPPTIPQYPPLFGLLPNGDVSLTPWNGYVANISGDGVKTVGNAYPAVYVSPVLAAQRFDRRKRLRHVYVQFDNVNGMATRFDTGKSQHQLDTNIAFMYLNEASEQEFVDTYRYDAIRHSSTLYVNHFSPKQIEERYTLFKEPLQGTSYAYQFGVYSLDAATWTVVGWQISAKLKGERVGHDND